MDMFVEQIVKRRLSYAQVLLMCALWVFGGFLGIAVVVFTLTRLYQFFILGLVLACGIWYGVIRLSREFSVEYEYSVTNDGMKSWFDIDQITAKSRRKRLLTVTLAETEEFGVYRPAEHEQRQYDLRISALSDKKAGNIYYLSARTPKKGHVLLTFQPDDRVLKAVMSHLPRQVLREFQNKQ